MVGEGKGEYLAWRLVFAKIAAMDIWSFNLRHLRGVTKIAELGTMNAAAQAVNLTQPAITQILKGLEVAFGVELVDRGRRGVNLNVAGLAAL